MKGGWGWGHICLWALPSSYEGKSWQWALWCHREQRKDLEQER